MKKKLFTLFFCGFAFVSRAQDTAAASPISKPNKFDWSGTISTNTGFYATTNKFNSSNPLSLNLSANINLRLYDAVDIPINFIAGKYQSNFTTPFLQFNIAPHYKWAKVYAGHNNLNFNPYTLAGHTFLGVGTELMPGKFRVAAMYGKFASAIEIDTTGKLTEFPSFKRMGYGLKIGYGNSDNYMDLIYFEAKDDTNSIKSWKDIEIQKKMGDAAILIPQANKVAGLSSKVSFTKDLIFNLDGGVSFLNKNIANPQIIDDGNIVKYAGKASLGYNFTNFYISADYERISPDYTSFGSYFFNNDIENLTISPSGMIDKGKGNYNLSVGLQQNNLDKTKSETTKRLIGNASINYNPTEKWSLLLNYNNFSVRQFSTIKTLTDSFLVRQVNQTFTFTPTYSLKKDSSIIHNFSFITNYNDVNDRNIITRQFGNMKSMMASLNYSTLFIETNNSINGGLNFNQINTFQYVNTQFGFTAGCYKNFLDNKLSVALNTNFNISLINSRQDGLIVNTNTFVNYRPKERHNFSINATIINSSSKQFNSYTELTGTVGYQFRLK